MARMEGFDYDEYTVYVDLPPGANLDKVINEGLKAMGLAPDPTIETKWIDSHYN